MERLGAKLYSWASLLEDGTHETGGPHGHRRGPGVRTYIHLVRSKWKQVNRAEG